MDETEGHDAKQIAVVTGAGQGIGAATALELARCGLDVALVDVNEDTLSGTVDGVQHATAVRSGGYVADVSDPDEVAELMARVTEELGPPTVLVNNAAIGRYAPVEQLSLEDWNRTIAVNLTGPFLCIREFLGRVPASGGAIVNIASIAGHLGSPGSSAYASSKGGIIAFTRVLAVELAPRRIRVNAVSPGPIDTELTAQLSDEATTARRLSRVPLARLGSGSEIATAVAFLATGASSFVTGQTLCVDGGWTAQSL